MRQRIVTRIGDIFRVVIDKKYKCYFQYIAKDMTQLNNTVIRVFKEKYSLERTPNMEEIVRGEVSFYAHTILRPGLIEGSWESVR